jgi:hypothetical protein
MKCGTDWRNSVYSIDEQMSNEEAKCYLDRYPDLTKAFGSDLTKAKEHWKNHGIKEKRNKACDESKPTKTTVGKVTKLSKSFHWNVMYLDKADAV